MFLQLMATSLLSAALPGLTSFLRASRQKACELPRRIAFADHHRYTAADLNSLVAKARNAGASALVTTEKDLLRLGSLADSLPITLTLKTAQLRIEIENEDAAIEWLISRLQTHQS